MVSRSFKRIFLAYNVDFSWACILFTAQKLGWPNDHTSVIIMGDAESTPLRWGRLDATDNSIALFMTIE